MATKAECNYNKDHYWKLYKKYSAQCDTIRKIRDNVEQPGCIKKVNNKISSCVSYMEKALKGSSAFDRNRFALESKKLKDTHAEYKLNQAYTYLNAEVNRLSGKAENAKDSYYYWRQKGNEAE